MTEQTRWEVLAGDAVRSTQIRVPSFLRNATSAGTPATLEDIFFMNVSWSLLSLQTDENGCASSSPGPYPRRDAVRVFSWMNGRSFGQA